MELTALSTLLQILFQLRVFRAIIELNPVRGKEALGHGGFSEAGYYFGFFDVVELTQRFEEEGAVSFDGDVTFYEAEVLIVFNLPRKLILILILNILSFFESLI